jgi:hypothetical protein
MINKQRIEEAAEKWTDTNPLVSRSAYVNAFTAGANFAAQEIMSKASKGFEEWFETRFPDVNHENVRRESWQASRLSSEKEIQQLKQKLEVAVEAISQLDKYIGMDWGFKRRQIIDEARAKISAENRIR